MRFEDKMFVLGVGAQKAGTTWLHDYLSKRGDIYLPARKEMHYFNSKYGPGRHRGHRLVDADDGRDPELLRTDNAYKDYFRRRVPEEIEFYGEITPAYAIIGKKGFREIRDLFPRRRIIFIMRDPVKRFYSQVRLFRDKRSEKDQPRRELESLLESRRFLERSRYDKTIRALEAAFAGEEIIYLFYETLFRPESIRLLCERVGLSYMPADFGQVVNSGGNVAGAPQPVEQRLLNVLQPAYRFCRERFGSEIPAEWHSGGPVGVRNRQTPGMPRRMGRPAPQKEEMTNGAAVHAAGRLPRVFIIGFNKCGTRTLHYYFESNGYRAVHWDKGKLARTVFQNLVDSRPLLGRLQRRPFGVLRHGGYFGPLRAGGIQTLSLSQRRLSRLAVRPEYARCRQMDRKPVRTRRRRVCEKMEADIQGEKHAPTLSSAGGRTGSGITRMSNVISRVPGFGS